jgi:hypothetical protein
LGGFRYRLHDADGGDAGEIELVQAAEGKDAYDHVAAGRTLDELAADRAPTGTSRDLGLGALQTEATISPV